MHPGLRHYYYYSGGVLSGYDYRRAITVVNTGNPNALDEDQISVSLTSSNFDFANAMTNGEDIRFTTADGVTMLNHWIESYSSVGQTATIWVKVTGVSAATSGTIYMYYGAPGSTTASSFTNTMTRFQTTEENAQYVVRFSDGSGSTAANIGSSSGTVALSGTWNAGDVYGGSTGSVTLNGTSDYIEETGLLDTWPTSGHIKISLKFVAFNAGQWIFAKTNRTDDGVGGDFGDLFNLWVKTVDKKLRLQWYRGAAQTIQLDGTTVFTTGTKYEISVTWNEKCIFVYVNGVLEMSTYATLVFPTGTATPFRIGCNSNYQTGARELFANIQVNDFCFQSGTQAYYSQIQAYHQNRTYYAKDEMSKWVVSLTPSNPPSATLAKGEPCMIYEDGLFKQWHSHYDDSTSKYTIWYRDSPSVEPNVETVWSNLTKVMGDGAGTHAGNAVRPMVRKFGSTYYLYFRSVGEGVAPSSGPISVATSSDGVTFSNITTCLDQPASGFGSQGFENTDVIFDPSDSLYKMMVEAKTTTIFWSMGLATASSPLGPFTLSGTNPKSTMAYDSGGPYGGPSLQLINGVFHCWYHALPTGSTDGVLPNDVMRAYSTDLSTWTKAYTRPVITRERAFEYDQSSDPDRLLDVNGACYMFYCGVDNRPALPLVYINSAKFEGSSEQLVTDLTVTVNGETAL